MRVQIYSLHTSVNKCLVFKINYKWPQPHFLFKFTLNPFRLPGGPQSQEAHQVVVSEPDPEAESRRELPHAGGGASSGDGHTRRDVWGTLRVPNTNQQPTASYSLDSRAFTRLVWIKTIWGNKLRALFSFGNTYALCNVHDVHSIHVWIAWWSAVFADMCAAYNDADFSLNVPNNSFSFFQILVSCFCRQHFQESD